MIEFMAEDERECLLAVAGIPDGDGVAEKALRIIDALEARVRELEAENGRLRKLLHRWRCFDFDCPEEEYDEATDTYAEDGAALERLQDDTGAALDAKIVECHPKG